jgi:hypothetical protein
MQRCTKWFSKAYLQPKVFVGIWHTIYKVYQLIPSIAANFIYINPCSTREVANSCIAQHPKRGIKYSDMPECVYYQQCIAFIIL